MTDADEATPPRVLVIEDDPSIRRFLLAALESNDYDASAAATARDGLARALSLPPDLVLLDLGLPDLDGLEVLSRLRGWSRVPIVILSARGRERDKVAALDAGADDYLTKPFGVAELMARVRVALRHAARRSEDSPAPVFRAGRLEFDRVRRTVRVAGQPVRLTPIEYRLLAALVEHAGKVLTHRHLLREVWGPRAVEESAYLRVYMGHLRHKLEADPARPTLLVTEPGVGYRLVDE